MNMTYLFCMNLSLQFDKPCLSIEISLKILKFIWKDICLFNNNVDI